MNDFNEDYETGLKAERPLAARLREVYDEVDHDEAYNPFYDIWVIDTDKRIEVKNDEASLRTPNFFIETSCQGHKSGIANTTAEVWAHYDGSEYIFLASSTLREIIQDYPERTSIIKKKQIMYHLIPKHVIREVGISLNINTCTDKVLSEALNQYGSS
tara:strand:+ start:40 stop:513 length:474 start_codon:yes stop_codon:yes gene_type:complete